MKWAWKVGVVAGIEIDLHFTFLLLLAWIALVYFQTFGTWMAVFEGVGFIIALFACVLLHEFGHAFAAKRYGIATSRIVLLPIGGVSSIARLPDEPGREIAIAIAGPLVSVAIAAALGIGLWLSGHWVDPREISVAGEHFLPRLMLVNALLAAFNLLPALPMDGGRILRAALSHWLGPEPATRVAARIAQALALVLALVGLHYNLLLVFIAVFIWVGAVAESGMARFRAGLAGVTAGQLMLRDFQVLGPEDTLERAVELTLAGIQKEFPVLSGTRLVGTLPQAGLLRGLRELGPDSPVSTAMDAEPATVNVTDRLDEVLEGLQRDSTRPSGLVAVLDHGQFVGVIDWDNVVEHALFAEARRPDAHWR